MCYWDSSTVTVNITEELPPKEPCAPSIPGYDISILLEIVIIGTYITFKRKVKKRKKGLKFN